jgi:type IV pilus assembly protein PilQ
MNSSQEYRYMRSWTAGAALVLALGLAFPVSSWAEPKIRSVTGVQEGGTDIIRVELSEPLKSVPAGFSVQSPPRVAIDLPGVSNASGKTSIDVNQGNVRSVSVASAGDRTRLVLNLRAASGYKAEIQGKTLVISLDSGAAATPVAAAPAATDATHFANPENAEVLDLRDIDFRRGADGAGRIVVNLTWSSNSCARPRRRACAVVSTSPTSARRCNPSPPRRRATACAWS